MFNLKVQSEKLKVLREKAFNDIQQDKLAKQLGISQSYYSNMEKGKRPISYNALNNISDRYKKEYPQHLLSLDWLLLGVGNMDIKENTEINIDIHNSNNTNIGFDGDVSQSNNVSERNYEVEIAVLNERIRGLENENKSLKDIIKTIAGNTGT